MPGTYRKSLLSLHVLVAVIQLLFPDSICLLIPLLRWTGSFFLGHAFLKTMGEKQETWRKLKIPPKPAPCWLNQASRPHWPKHARWPLPTMVGMEVPFPLDDIQSSYRGGRSQWSEVTIQPVEVYSHSHTDCLPSHRQNSLNIQSWNTILRSDLVTALGWIIGSLGL